MAFPRLVAIAEVAWSSPAQRSWESFQSRIAIQGKRWKMNKIGFYRSPKVTLVKLDCIIKSPDSTGVFFMSYVNSFFDIDENEPNMPHYSK